MERDELANAVMGNGTLKRAQLLKKRIHIKKTEASESGNSGLSDKLYAMNAQITELAQKLNKTKEKHKKLKDQVKNNASTIVTHSQTHINKESLEEAVTKLAFLEQQNLELKKQFETTEIKVRYLDETQAGFATTTDLHTSKEALKEAITKLTLLENHNLKLKENLEATKSQIQSLNHSLDSQKNDFNEKLNQNTQETLNESSKNEQSIAEIQQLIEILTESNSALQTKINKIKEQADSKIEYVFQRTVINTLDQITTQAELANVKEVLEECEIYIEDDGAIALAERYVSLEARKAEAEKYNLLNSSTKLESTLSTFAAQVDMSIVAKIKNPNLIEDSSDEGTSEHESELSGNLDTSFD